MAEDTGLIDRTLNAIGEWLAEVLAKVGDYLHDAFKPIVAKTTEWLNTVFSRLKDLAADIGNYISSLVESIKGSISSLVDDALNFINSVYDRVANSITSLFDSVTGYLQDAFTAVLDKVISIAQTVKEQIVGFYDKVVDQIKSIVSTITTWLGGLLDDIKLRISSLLDRATAVVTAISQGIQDFITNVIDTVGVGLRTLLEATAEIPTALAAFGDDVKLAIKDFIGDQINRLPADMVAKWAEEWDNAGEQFNREVDVVKRIFSGDTGSAPKSMAQYAELTQNLIPKSGITGLMFNMFISFQFIAGVMGGVSSAQAQAVLNDFGREFPYIIPNEPDSISMYRYGIIDKITAIDFIRQKGYSEENANRLIQIGETTPPEGEALAWWKRGLYSDDDINTALRKRGWSDKDADTLKQAADVIPPIQDIITMAVREAFSPATAERFGQYEDFPDDFALWAEKLGLSEEWAKRYWASHWGLPSPQMGFEMLHRRIIDQSDLELLLKAADVMPFWRDKIIQMSYSPLTRVDVRRMHQVGVLDDGQVYEAYQDLGYSKENAQRLTDFTVELNRPTAADDETTLKELTRSNIVGFYEDGLLDKVTAYDMLINAGYSSDAANLYLLSIDLSEQRQERKDSTKLILDRAKAGLISFEDAQDELADLGLETKEMAKALTRLVRDKEARTKLPSKTDLEDMLKGGIIDERSYSNTMRLLGYSDYWVQRYIELLGA